MRLTHRELALILQALHFAVGEKADFATGTFMPMSEGVERLIAAMELFLDREKAT
jgi:hypothetical protein